MDYASSRAGIEDTVARFVLALDARDIDGAIACLAPRVRWDYTSVTGQPAAEIEAGALAARWRTTLIHTDASQHFLSMPGIRIAGSRATCVVHAQVTVRLANRIGSSHLTTSGTYTFELAQSGAEWKIDAVAMAQLWSDGNPRIMELAAERGVRR